MRTTGDAMRALLFEAREIALDHFGAETIANVPLLVTHIALTMTQIEEAARADMPDEPASEHPTKDR